MFAKKRANVRNFGFCAFYKLCALGKESAVNFALRKQLYVTSLSS